MPPPVLAHGFSSEGVVLVGIRVSEEVVWVELVEVDEEIVGVWEVVVGVEVGVVGLGEEVVGVDEGVIDVDELDVGVDEGVVGVDEGVVGVDEGVVNVGGTVGVAEGVVMVEGSVGVDEGVVCGVVVVSSLITNTSTEEILLWIPIKYIASFKIIANYLSVWMRYQQNSRIARETLSGLHRKLF